MLNILVLGGGFTRLALWERWREWLLRGGAWLREPVVPLPPASRGSCAGVLRTNVLAGKGVGRDVGASDCSCENVLEFRCSSTHEVRGARTCDSCHACVRGINRVQEGKTRVYLQMRHKYGPESISVCGCSWLCVGWNMSGNPRVGVDACTSRDALHVTVTRRCGMMPGTNGPRVSDCPDRQMQNWRRS